MNSFISRPITDLEEIYDVYVVLWQMKPQNMKRRDY
jgi:hypothetical protein